MSTKNPQYCIYEQTFNGRVIAVVQICPRCETKLPYKRDRKHCPVCQCLLKTTTTIMKVPQSSS